MHTNCSTQSQKLLNSRQANVKIHVTNLWAQTGNYTTQLRNTKKTNDFDNVLPKSNQLLLVDTRTVVCVWLCGHSLWMFHLAHCHWPTITFSCTHVSITIASPSKGNDIPSLMKLLLPKTSSPVNPFPFSALGAQPSLSISFCPAPSTQPGLTNQQDTQLPVPTTVTQTQLLASYPRAQQG